MSLIKVSKFCLAFSTILVVASAVLLFVPGPKLSMEFTGGTLMNITVPGKKTKDDIAKVLDSFRMPNGKTLGNFSISLTKESSALIRIRDISNEEHLALLDHLQKNLGAVKELQFTTIGPTVGESLKRRSIGALIIASIGIVVYIAIAFRKVPRKLSPWRFGFFAVLAMVHDILVTSGIFTILSLVSNFEVDTLFITALLTILGYSVNDTIIIFDRIRENMSLQEKHETLEATVEKSFRETLTRTINTTVTTLITLVCLYFLGSESIKWFILALIIGISFGTYSSYFVATPLLIFWRKRE